MGGYPRAQVAALVDHTLLKPEATVADVEKLVAVSSRLVERGDTVVVIEHHPLVIAGADWVVELGPDGGERGGRIVAEGPPAKVAARKTPTGAVLRALAGEKPAPRAPNPV